MLLAAILSTNYKSANVLDMSWALSQGMHFIKIRCGCILKIQLGLHRRLPVVQQLLSKMVGLPSFRHSTGTTEKASVVEHHLSNSCLPYLEQQVISTSWSCPLSLMYPHIRGLHIIGLQLSSIWHVGNMIFHGKPPIIIRALLNAHELVNES